MDNKELNGVLDRVFALLDTWATDRKDLTLIYGSANCRIQQNGLLGKFSNDSYGFKNHSGLRVLLHPDEWKSLKLEENRGVVLVIDGGPSYGGFILRENTEKVPEPIEIPKEVNDQIARWAKEGKVLHVLFHLGFVTIPGIFRVHSASEGHFILIDEKTQDLHFIDLELCSGVELREKNSFCSIALWDANQEVEIGEVRGTTEDALRRSTSNLIH
jgi:hypothetical protein